VWTPPTEVGSGVRLLESFDHSRGRGEPGGEVLPGGDGDRISADLQNGEEEEDLAVELQFKCSSTSSVDTSLLFEPSPRAVGGLESPLSSPSIEGSNSSGSTSDASNNRMPEDKWVCDFQNCGQIFSKRHEWK
jgi:hypothetical protein